MKRAKGSSSSSRLYRRWFALVLLALANITHADQIEVKVVRVIDGDTIVVLSEQHKELRVRLAGIDCPEKRRKQPYWRFSKDALSDRVSGQTITVDFGKRDRWGRMIGVVWLNGQDVNAKMVSIGACWHFKKYQHEQSEHDREHYSQLESAARQGRLGLWADANAVAPWDWRSKTN